MKLDPSKGGHPKRPSIWDLHKKVQKFTELNSKNNGNDWCDDRIFR